MSEELKPCPFCGGEADPEGWMNGDGECGPECESCGATASSVIVWNRRAELTAIKAGQGEMMPYAYEYGKDNGDGSYSVTITRGQIPSYLTPVKDWPIKPLYTAPPDSADSVSVAPGLERAIQIVREVAKTQPGYSDEREAIFEALSEEYVVAMAPPCTSAAVMSVPIGLLRNICSMVPEKMKPARKELRALLAQSESEGVK